MTPEITASAVQPAKPPLPPVGEKVALPSPDSFEAAREALDIYGVQPAASVFPVLSDSELAELADDIAKNGLIEPIVTFEGKILDGRNRFIACHLREDLEEELRFVEWRKLDWSGDSGSLVSFVISKNLKRRHLDTSQRALIAAGLVPLFAEEAKARQGARTDISAGLRGSDFGKATEKAAERMSVSPRSVESASKVLRDGIPELAEAVKSGQMAVSAAAEIAARPAEEQRGAITAAKTGLPPAPPPNVQDPNTVARWKSVHVQFQNVVQALAAVHKDIKELDPYYAKRVASMRRNAVELADIAANGGKQPAKKDKRQLALEGV